MNDEYYHQAGSLTPDEAYALLKKSSHGIEGQARGLRQDWREVKLRAIAPSGTHPFIIEEMGNPYIYCGRIFFQLKKELPNK